MRIITQLLFVAALAVSFNLSAQYTTYDHAYAMPFFKSTKTFTNLTGATALASTFNADEQMLPVPIGFTFNFCGVNYNTIYACSNGWLSFKNVTYGGSSRGWYFDNDPTLSGAQGNVDSVTPGLFPFWDDLQGSTTATTSTVSYKTTGSAPARIFTIEYKNWRFYGGSGPSLSFQVILYENGGNNQIEFLYRQEATAPSGNDGATIGIADSKTSINVLTSASSNPSQSFTTFIKNITTRPATGQSYMWGSPLKITSLPANRIVCSGANTTFSIISPNATQYQWQVDFNGTGFHTITNNATYSGATTNTLTVSNVQTTMNNYKYRCIISAPAYGGIFTTPATLQVNAQLISDPTPKTTCEGVPATFTATAIGVGLTYQWQVNTGIGGFQDVSNGSDYSGVNTKTLTVSNPTGGMNGYLYRCQINNSCTTPLFTNSNIGLTVRTVPIITTTLADKNVCSGTSTSFNIDATGSNLTYQWQEDAGSGFSSLSNSSQYSGVNTKTLQIANAATYMSGYRYQCVATGICGSPATSNFAMMTVDLSTKILVEPVTATTVCDSTDIKLFVKAQGTSINYQWKESINNAPYASVINVGIFSGANSDTLTITAPTSAVSNRKYVCVVTGTCGSPATSVESHNTIYPKTEITQEPADDSVGELQHAFFTVAANGKDLTYQWQVNDGTNAWQNLFDNFAYKGATTTKLEVIGSYVDKDGYRYRCVVDGLCGLNDTSIDAVLTVAPPPNSVKNISYGNSNITVYPNPVSGSDINIKIDHATTLNMTVKITDMFGRVMLEEAITMSKDNKATIGIANLVPGIYNLHVYNAENQLLNTAKFTKY